MLSIATGAANWKTVAPSYIYLPESEMTLAKGTSLQMFAIVQTENATHYGVTWSSDNPAVVSVNAATGQISAIANGTAKITATIPKTTKKATCVVTVMTPAKTVQITPNTLTLTINSPTNSTGTLTTKVKPADASQTVKWYSVNTAIAKVNGSELVTAVSEGTVRIYAEAADGSGVRGSCVVTVKPPIAVNSVQLPDPIVVFADGNGATSADRPKTVVCTIKPSTATDKTFNFSLNSSNKATAELTNDGKIEVVGVQSGTAKLTVRSNDGAAAWTSDVIVVERVPSYNRYTVVTTTMYNKLGTGGSTACGMNTEITIIGQIDKWYYVKAGNVYGFILQTTLLSETRIGPMLASDKTEFGVNSDTYKILADLENRWLKSSAAAQTDIENLAVKVRELARAGTPILYAQNKVMNQLHANAKTATDFQKSLPSDQYSGTTAISYLITMAFTGWNYKLNSNWQVPLSYNYFDGNDMNKDNNRNWRAWMYFDGMLMAADDFGNLNMAYAGKKMGLPEIVYKNFTTTDGKDAFWVQYGIDLAKSGR
jgi:uncharacterized protein YjdB